MKIQAFGDKVILELDPPRETTTSGLIINETNANDQYATVVSVGEGRFAGDGTAIPIDVEPGDRVLFDPRQAVPFPFGENYRLIGSFGILAVVTE
jgi:chaperonin GroES